MLYTYIDHKGESLFEKWFHSIEYKEPSVFHKTCSILQQMNDNTLPLEPPNVRRMKKRTGNNHLYKIRIGKYRLFFLLQDDHYYLLHTFRKSTQKTPEAEIKQVMKEVKNSNFQPFSF